VQCVYQGLRGFSLPGTSRFQAHSCPLLGKHGRSVSSSSFARLGSSVSFLGPLRTRGELSVLATLGSSLSVRFGLRTGALSVQQICLSLAPQRLVLRRSLPSPVASPASSASDAAYSLALL
jgi:hypothetical protein